MKDWLTSFGIMFFGLPIAAGILLGIVYLWVLNPIVGGLATLTIFSAIFASLVD